MAPPAVSGEVLPTPPRLRRRPILIALSLVFVAVGALLAAYLVTALADTQPVVAVRADVARGQVIERSDLLVVDISPDPALKTVPGDQLESLVGKFARVDLAAGGLVTSSAVTDQNLPAAGESLVGISLTPAQLPAHPLSPGDNVRIVTTPRQQDDPPTKAPTSVTATVVGTRPVGDQGQVVVNVTVPQSAAAQLAAVAATGRIALILDRAN
jgi:hypothetical protein